MLNSPLYELSGINCLDNRFYIKREDLLPFSFGGNKLRIAEEFFADMEKKNRDCIIGYGGQKSNLCRVLANMASEKGIPCHIVCPVDETEPAGRSVNGVLAELCGAVIHKCPKRNVSETIERVVTECIAQGFKPYYINGDKFGKGNEAVPVRAYAKVYYEIKAQELETDGRFDYIFLATGTGMTQAGLICGRRQTCSETVIAGISVAREAAAEKQIIKKYCDAYCEENGYPMGEDNDIIIYDGNLCGGYGRYTEATEELMRSVYRKTGIPLDPTYTGKAFEGMLKYLKENGISSKNILFIHTGGTPLFCDYAGAGSQKAEVRQISDFSRLYDFLTAIDASLPTPLSSRVNLKQYAEKILKNGVALSAERNGAIVSSAMFYCNDRENGEAYLTLLGTIPGYEGNGYASCVMDKAEEFAKKNGMKKMCLETEMTNREAVGFYSRRGFVIRSCAEKLRMEKEL